MPTNIAELRTKIANGVVPAMATPLTPGGYEINFEALGALVDLLIGAGVNGLFVGGTTGEGLLLAPEQRERLFDAALAAAGGRVPILVHVGANTTREAQILAEHAVRAGADAVVAIPPIFYPIPDDTLLPYFEALAGVTPELPFLVYDIPHMAINGISPALLRRLLEVIPNFAGVKSSRGDAQIVRRLIDAAGEEAMVLVGNERIALGSLGLGGTGLISGLATAVPEPFVAMMRAFAANDLAAARSEQRRINQLLDLIPSDVRIGAIKSVLQQRGIAVGPAVPPRAMPKDDALWEKMRALL